MQLRAMAYKSSISLAVTDKVTDSILVGLRTLTTPELKDGELREGNVEVTFFLAEEKDDIVKTHHFDNMAELDSPKILSLDLGLEHFNKLDLSKQHILKWNIDVKLSKTIIAKQYFLTSLTGDRLAALVYHPNLVVTRKETSSTIAFILTKDYGHTGTFLCLEIPLNNILETYLCLNDDNIENTIKDLIATAKQEE